MSIQEQRSQSLSDGWFAVKTNNVWCSYTYATTQGRLSREKPLQSVGRWLRPTRETLRRIFIKNKRMFI